MNRKNLLIVAFINVCIILVVFIFTEIFIISPKASVWKWAKENSPEKLTENKFSEKGLTKQTALQISNLLYKDWEAVNKDRYKEYWDSLTIKLSTTAKQERVDLSSTSGNELRWCINDNNIEYIGISNKAFISPDSISDDSLKTLRSSFFEDLTYKKMKFKYKTFGDEEFGDKSLFISLHGGGNVAHEFNDKQWENQINLYTPKAGIYVAPRAPENDWNMWFKPYMPYFYEELIRSAISVMGVNPDKIYIMGYSAGGDGLYRIAPIFADKFASAAMMAGHPGDISPLSLMNLPYTIWMGEKDATYSRNICALNWGNTLDSLQNICAPGHYIHSLNIVKNKGHWMEKADTAAIDWMAQFKRNPYPNRIVWKNDKDLMPGNFYWVSIDDINDRRDSYLVVNHIDNVFEIEECNINKFTINLNDEFVDLDRQIIVKYKNKEIYNLKPKRTIKNIYESIYKRGDKRYIFSAKIDVVIP